MKWIPWITKEPEDNEWIFTYTDERTMGIIKYRKSDSNWESDRLKPHSRKIWTYWLPLQELPRPPVIKSYPWWLDEKRRTDILKEDYGIKKDIFIDIKTRCPLCDKIIDKHDTTLVRDETAFVCYGKPHNDKFYPVDDVKKAIMIWMNVQSKGETS